MTSPSPQDRLETLFAQLGSTGRLILDATRCVREATDETGAVINPDDIRRAQEMLTEAQMALGRSRSTLAGIKRNGDT
ncbi:hypothetical protein [Nocardiopsis synnemataformans]|uniref:hypothetical protein n=1 Tax=Nocardiopsis synnemataformans TaxID=61305 RepID=UPI003EBBA8FE